MRAAFLGRRAKFLKTGGLDPALHHRPFFRKRRLTLKHQREQRDRGAECAQRHGHARHFGVGESGRDEIGQFVKADRRAEHQRDRSHHHPADAAPHALGHVALEHGLATLVWIVIDGDSRPDRIAREGFGDFEIAAILADGDAVVAIGLPRDHIFIGDVREVPLLVVMPRLAVAIDDPDVARFRLRDHHLARHAWPVAGGADFQIFVDRREYDEADRRQQHRINEPRNIRQHRYLARVRASQMPPPIMKPPEMRETRRTRRAESSLPARPASRA